MYEILVTGPLCTSECAGECHFSANLCKRPLNVTAGIFVEVAHNADILTINANVFVDASVSGRMMKEHLKTFFLSVLNPHLLTNSQVHCGSWSGYRPKDEQELLEASGGKDVDLKIITPKTTKYAQPLDVYFFKQ